MEWIQEKMLFCIDRKGRMKEFRMVGLRREGKEISEKKAKYRSVKDM
jgi:hypothetical protein